MKKIKLLLTVMTFAALTVGLKAQNSWVQVSTILDSYLRINKAENGTYLCSAATNDIYISEDLISWTSTTVSFPSQPHLAFNKDQNNNLYIATSHNGLYKSPNNGVTWSYSNVGFGFGCGSLDFASDDLNTLYVGVGGSCRGLHVSWDEGLTWENMVPNRDFTDIEAVNSLGLVYACSTNNHVFYTGDNGNYWQQIIGQPFSNNAIMIKHFGNDIFIFCNNGDIYKTSNGGLTWSFYSNVPIEGTASAYANDLVFVSAETWWVGFELNGIWRSTDGGLTWTQLDNGISGNFRYLFEEDSVVVATTNQGIFMYNDSVSIEESKESEASLSIYPNPAVDEINISSNSSLIGKEYIIYDLLGKEIIRADVTNENNSVQIRDLISGVYLVRVDGYLQKIVKQ